jgi:hypothetical protein
MHDNLTIMMTHCTTSMSEKAKRPPGWTIHGTVSNICGRAVLKRPACWATQRTCTGLWPSCLIAFATICPRCVLRKQAIHLGKDPFKHKRHSYTTAACNQRATDAALCTLQQCFTPQRAAPSPPLTTTPVSRTLLSPRHHTTPPAIKNAWPRHNKQQAPHSKLAHDTVQLSCICTSNTSRRLSDNDVTTTQHTWLEAAVHLHSVLNRVHGSATSLACMCARSSDNSMHTSADSNHALHDAHACVAAV